MTLMRFDPFRELDRLTERTIAQAARTMPMEALRRGDEFAVYLDVPGVNPDDVDVTVENNVVTIRARRMPQREEGDEVIADERTYGEFTRQLFLGDNLGPRPHRGPRQRGAHPAHPGQRSEQAPACRARLVRARGGLDRTR